jgi:hypothetical protein|tara:strand:- start:334 stop:582 length:249 start_codon:yes stop_codon:yes gene_type:complete
MKEAHSLSEILLKRLDETTVHDLRKLNAVLFPVKYAVSRFPFHSYSLVSAMVQLFLLTLFSSYITRRNRFTGTPRRLGRARH